MAARRADFKAYMEARLAALHAGLQLTPEQQSLWAPVEGALRDLVKARHAMRHARHHGMDEDDRSADSAARLKQRGDSLIAMGQAMGKLADATGPLLGSLTPDQKNRLPVLLHGVGPHRLVRQAFGVEGSDGRGHGGLRFGMHEDWRHEDWRRWQHEGRQQDDSTREGMSEDERGGRHRHFADRDDRDRADFDRRGFDHPGMDHPMDRFGDRDGWHGRHPGWDREGRADGDDRGDRFDRGDGASRPHGQDDGADERT